MPTSASTPLPAQSPLEAWQEAFERFWLAATSGGPEPFWADFLPPAGEPCPLEFVLRIIQTDIACRLQKGQTILAPEVYFQHPRLQAMVAVLSPAQQAEVIRWEYTQRWKGGDCVRRQHYLTRFPHLAQALHDLAPRWDCPRCQRTGIPLLDEAAETATCPSCAHTVAVAEVFARPRSGPMPGRAGAPRPELPPVAGRYRPVQFHAEGGLGKVYRAEDTELQREVALKHIKPQLADHPPSRRHFLVEAEITARLEHPGIVPVYGLVADSAGRPCYAMRFIEGPTLADALTEFHAADRKGGRDPGERGLAFRKLLGHFIAACNAIAYAHSRGILHRDLKPANILLGKYGETLVVDWGLAKPFERTEAEWASGEETLRPAREVGTEDATWSGQAKGTPAYMSPEQAAGRLGEMGPASDIFALGATLYALLTGQAPYASDAYQALDKARRAEFVPPRQLQRAVPRSLEGICRKAMALQPKERYAMAKELGEEVERWLADEPVAAYREPPGARARRWMRRHRPLVAGVTALLLATLLLGGSGLGWFRWQQTAIERAVEMDLREAELLQERERWPEALQALERAEGRLTGRGAAHLRPRIAGLRESVVLVRELEEARLQEAAIQGHDFDLAGADRAYAAAFAGHGLDLTALPPDEAARRLRALPIRTRLATALDEWAYVRERLPGGNGEPLRVIARLADDDPWRKQIRDPALRKDPAGLKRLARTRSALEQPAASVALLGLALRARQRSGAAERLLRQAQERHPDDFWLNFDLASLLRQQKPGGAAKAIGYYQAALACRPGTAVVYNNLGVALHEARQLPEAQAAFHQAIALQPDYPLAYNNLGAALAQQHDLPAAVAAFQKAIALKADYAEAYTNLGGALREQHKLPEAVAACRQAIALQPNSARAYARLGSALHEQRKLPEAVAACRKAIELDPDLAPAYTTLGDTLREQHKLPEAIAACRKAIELDPDSAEAYNNLGNALYEQRTLPEALAAFRKAIELRPDLAEPYNNLGTALAEQHELPEAIAAFRKAIALKPGYALAYSNLGNALRDQRQLPEAVAACRQAIELDPDLAEAYANLGNALRQQRQLPEAVAAYRRAIELQPGDAKAYNNLGAALGEHRQPAEAVAAFRKAIALDPGYAEAYANLGASLHEQRQLPEAVAAYRKAIALQPDLAMAYCNLGLALQQQGQFAAGLASLKQGHELGSRRPHWRIPSAELVRRAERLVQLDAQLSRVLSGEAQPADAAERVALAELCQLPSKQLYAAAVRLYRDAFAAEPKLAEDLSTGTRYNAACAAALAGTGQGKDAAELAERERARLRQQAFSWLRADLDAWKKKMAIGKPEDRASAKMTLHHWMEDSDLAPLRNAAALVKLPPDERAAWAKLWNDVQTLQAEAAQK
jgi:tetratricopeptide (TPR) repeat protein/tRNA A-37 threonylcarbamoyl transferase component Bud32